jgi:hypothetical protein
MRMVYVDEHTHTRTHTKRLCENAVHTYVRMLFIDYSSAFNTIVPLKLFTKRRTQGLNTSLYNWIPVFLAGRPMW